MTAPSAGAATRAPGDPTKLFDPRERSTAPSRRGGRRRLAALAVALLAVASGATAVVASVVVFPYLSDNNDEAIYLLQAGNLLQGELFMPVPDHPASFRPWLSAIVDDRYVFKYSPVHPGILAGARLLFGTDRAALFVIAAAAVVTAYLLAREMLDRRRDALLASAFLALSPLFVIQSGMFLAYLSTLVLLQGFAAALLAGVRRGSSPLLALAGLLLGTAFFSRPYDTLLFATPLLAWLVYRSRGALRRLAQESVWLALGGIAPLLAMLSYYDAATGHPLQTPFSLLDASDSVGFGERRMLPMWEAVEYTPARAWEGLSRYLVLDSFWTFGGLVAVGLAVVGFRRRQRGGVDAWLAAVLLTVPVGYFLFWGTYGSTEWGAPWRIGPFYHMLVLVPLAILAARGFCVLWTWDRAIASLAAVGMVALSAGVVLQAVQANRPFNEERRRLYQPLLDVDLEQAIVFLPPLQGEWLMLPFALARNTAGYDGPVVWAIDRGDHRNLQVLAGFRDRVPYRLRAIGSHAGSRPTLDFDTRLERLAVLRGTSVTLDVVLGVDPLGPTTVEVGFGPRIDSFVVDGGTLAEPVVTLVLEPDRTRIEGPVLSHSTRPRGAGVPTLSVALVEQGADGQPRQVTQERLAVSSDGGSVEILVPAELHSAPDGRDQVLAIVAPGAYATAATRGS